MPDTDLEIYGLRAVENGITHAKQIHPSSVVTAPWVRLKCQFGCTEFDRTYCCPPHTSTAEQTRAILDAYRRAILFHLEVSYAPERRKRTKRLMSMLADLEGEMFKDGYYKAFLLKAGPCRLCEECAKLKNMACVFPDKARPSMEGVGIDVYQTARNNGFFVKTLRDQTETENHYCLMLVD